jgi:hypothetical protein
MPLASRFLPAPDFSSGALVTTPHINPVLINDLIAQTSSLVQSLDLSDLHLQSLGDGLYSIDFEAATAFWYTIKKLARTIILAANPGMDRHHIRPIVPRARLAEIGMPPPAIVGAYGYTQNPVFTSGTAEEIVEKYRRAQSIGIDAIRWISEAKIKCSTVPNGWRWDTSPSEVFSAITASQPRLTSLDESKLVEYFYDDTYASDDDEVDNSLALVKYVPSSNTSSSTSTIDSTSSDGDNGVVDTSKKIRDLLAQLETEQS